MASQTYFYMCQPHRQNIITGETTTTSKEGLESGQDLCTGHLEDTKISENLIQYGSTNIKQAGTVLDQQITNCVLFLFSCWHTRVPFIQPTKQRTDRSNFALLQQLSDRELGLCAHDWSTKSMPYLHNLGQDRQVPYFVNVSRSLPVLMYFDCLKLSISCPTQVCQFIWLLDEISF